MNVSAKSVVLEVLSAGISVHRETLPVKLLVQAASVFDIAENSVRVAIVRLRDDGLLESPARGAYSLGPAAHAVNEQVHAWRSVSERVREWEGSWMGVFTANLSRTDRPALRRRTRALHFLGFEELKPGLFLRPSNLRIDIERVRQKLISLGLEPEAVSFEPDSLTEEEERRARSLWDASALETSYDELHRKLVDSQERIEYLPLQESVRETFLLGRAGIRQMVLDPLLPRPLIDENKRAVLLETLHGYSDKGMALWQRFLQLE